MDPSRQIQPVLFLGRMKDGHLALSLALTSLSQQKRFNVCLYLLITARAEGAAGIIREWQIIHYENVRHQNMELDL